MEFLLLGEIGKGRRKKEARRKKEGRRLAEATYMDMKVSERGL